MTPELAALAVGVALAWLLIVAVIIGWLVARYCYQQKIDGLHEVVAEQIEESAQLHDANAALVQQLQQALGTP